MLASSFSNKAEATSCGQIFPVVGIIDTITEDEFYAELLLDDVYTFDTSDFAESEEISIDWYINTVNTYVKNNFRLSEKPKPEFREWADKNKVSLPTKVLDTISLKKGDIIITGPPRHDCNYGFSGLFTRDGKLQYTFVYDNYQDYSYHNSKLVVEVGKELQCDKKDNCKMEVNYQLDGKSFQLSPGQSYTPHGGIIKFISLLDSNDQKKRSDGTAISFLGRMGLGTDVSYLISFQDSEIKLTPSPSSSLMSTPTPTPKLSPIPAPVERLNIFQTIFRWFVTLFK